MFQRLKNILIGEPLTHDDSGDEHLLSKIQALAMLSSDALSSIAYGPEQVVLVLTAVSSAAIWWSIPIGWFLADIVGLWYYRRLFSSVTRSGILKSV